jgi:nicotinate-nucleotide adenylyltransferase
MHEWPLRPLTEKQEGDESLWVAHFGGSFNPVHIGHIAIGHSLIDEYSFDRVVYVPASSHNPKPSLATEAARLALLQTAIAEEPRFEACEYELGKDDWTEPFETLMHLKDRYTQETESVRLFTVRGDDYLPQMMTWTDELAEHEGLYEFIIVPRIRPSLEGISASPEQIDLVSRMSYLMESQEPLEVSSSLVRERIQEGTTSGLPIPAVTLDQIQRQGLYGMMSEVPEAPTERNEQVQLGPLMFGMTNI